MLLSVLVWCAIPLSPNTVDSDFWGHVQYGMDTLDHGIAYTSTYTYSSEGYRWINHENLSEITFALIVRHLGPNFVLILKCLLGCFVLGLMINQANKQGVSTLVSAFCAVLVSINLSFYWGIRPQFFSFVFFAILLAFYESRCIPKTDTQSLDLRFTDYVFVFLLFGIWTNTHGGFLAGVGVFVMLMGLRTIQSGWHRDYSAVRTWTLLAAIAIGVTFVNPYGIQLHLWLLESLRVPRPEIPEWHPPNLFALSAVKTWLVLLLSGAGFALSKNPKDWIKIVVFVAVLLQALSHQRHLPFVALLFGFWLPKHLDELARRASRAIRPLSFQWSGAGRRAAVVLFGFLTLVYGFQVRGRLRAIQVSTRDYPVDAVQFMADNDFDGRVVVSGEWAQYLIHVLGARRPSDLGCRVAFDGRFRTCYPQTVVDRHFDFFSGSYGSEGRYRSPDSPPREPTRALEIGDPELVLVKHEQTTAVQTLEQNTDWTLLYRDQTAQLWGLAANHRQLETIAAENPTRHVPWPAAPNQTATVLTSNVSH